MTALLVTGGRGQLGADLAAAATRAGLSAVWAPGSRELDVTDAVAVRTAVAALPRGAAVVNAAAYTAVDAAESDPERAAAVNASGAGYVAAACAARGVPLVHLSTDYVFDGTSQVPYRVEDVPAPRSVYGRTKLAGERAVLDAGGYVVRTAWLYGAHGPNFVRTMARLERTRDTVTVVDDQRGGPTWTGDLAAALVALVQAVHRVPPGVLHCVNGGATTWCGLARAVFAELGADPARVRPCTTAEFPRPAPRPANSVLDTASWTGAGLPPLRAWRAALAAAFATSGEQLRA